MATDGKHKGNDGAKRDVGQKNIPRRGGGGGALHCFDGGGGTDGSIAWPTVLFVFQPLPFYYLIIIILFSVVSLATGENTGRPATARKLKSIRTSCIHEETSGDVYLFSERDQCRVVNTVTLNDNNIGPESHEGQRSWNMFTKCHSGTSSR